MIEYTIACTITYDSRVAPPVCILTCTDLIDDSLLRLVYDRYGYRSDKCRIQVNGDKMLYISELIYKKPTNIGTIPLIRGSYNQNILDAIHSLNLSDNGLSYIPPIKSIKNLKLVNFSRNNLTEAVLSNINELNMLNEIDFSFNKITDIKINDLGYKYLKLTKINLSHNHLVNIPEAIFDEFRDLQILDLSFNHIERLTAVTFEGVRKMYKLDLSNNKIQNLNASLFRFNELNYLNLSNNQIGNLQSNDFKQLPKLVTLDLSSNVIKVIDVNVFESTIMLETLDLSNNLLQIINSNAFINLHSLSDIDLSKNDLKTLPTHLFKNSKIFKFCIDGNSFEGPLTKGMFEGINVTRLDVSNQFLTEINDYAFQNLDNLVELFLNSNNITFLSSQCLKYLVSLKYIDLSNNQITNINFDKNDLTNLLSLRLKNNLISEIKPEGLASLRSLQFLDISENRISHFSSTCFQPLKNLINLEIHSNPLVDTIETGTFAGLTLLPSLDISYSMLTAIQNASFSEMHNLKEVNITHCEINELQYNVFIYTGNIELLDLSFNKLTDFFVNTTELGTLTRLYLNNNLIKTISSTSLRDMSRLNIINLSYNVMESMPSEVNLTHLQHLDLSYNVELNFTVSMLRETKSLRSFIMSGVRKAITFKNILSDSSIIQLIISNCSISHISELHLQKLVNLAFVDLSFNTVSQLQVGDFKGLSSLNFIDLAYNKISFIQPGAFKDNTFLNSLNISHNSISSVNYGIFRGLNSLKILDMSYNKIKNLQGERFYEVKHLTDLIVDFNQIQSIEPKDFDGTSLSKLSIGNNPIDCQVLVKLHRINLSFQITAIGLDEHSDENVNGIICNNVREAKPKLPQIDDSNDYTILKSLGNILNNFNKKSIENEAKDNIYLEKISNSLENVSQILIINNKTNALLSKLIKSLEQTTTAAILTTSMTPPTTTHGFTTRRATYTPTKNSNVIQTRDIMSYIIQIKKELENSIAFEKQNIINQIESKILSKSNDTELLPANVDHRKLVSSTEKVSKSLFIETYVALILSVTLFSMFIVILLYRLFKTKSRGNFSVSNHVLPGAIDNSSF